MSVLVVLSVSAAAVAAQAGGANHREQAAVLDYGACLAKHSAGRASRAILEAWSGREMAAQGLLHKDVCIRKGTRMRFAPDIIRGAMAQALVGTELQPGDVAAVASAPALAYDLPAPLRSHDDKGRASSAASLQRQKDAVATKTSFIAVSQFGECLARAHSAGVVPLVKSQPGSDAERAALEAFGPVMPSCVPRGVTLEIDRPRLRNSVAIAYYRLAMAARSARGGVSAQ